MLLVYGSKHSLLPRIWAVDAVGMGAMSNELRMPCSLISSFKMSHSQRSDGFTPQRSNWSLPSLAGEPSNVSYAPSSLAMSLDAVQAA